MSRAPVSGCAQTRISVPAMGESRLESIAPAEITEGDAGVWEGSTEWERWLGGAWGGEADGNIYLARQRSAAASDVG